MNREIFIARRLFTALASARRLTILSHLKHGPMCLSDFVVALNTAPSTLTQHLKVLVRSGLLATQKRGRLTYYSISEKGSANVMASLQYFTAMAADQDEPSC